MGKKRKIENKGMMDGKVDSLRNEDEKRIKKWKEGREGKKEKRRKKGKEFERAQ